MAAAAATAAAAAMDASSPLHTDVFGVQKKQAGYAAAEVYGTSKSPAAAKLQFC